MSVEQLKSFLAKVQAHKTQQEKLNAEGVDPVAIAKEAGFSITTQDLNSPTEISDEELEGVAGGYCIWMTGATHHDCIDKWGKI